MLRWSLVDECELSLWALQEPRELDIAHLVGANVICNFIIVWFILWRWVVGLWCIRQWSLTSMSLLSLKVCQSAWVQECWLSSAVKCVWQCRVLSCGHWRANSLHLNMCLQVGMLLSGSVPSAGVHRFGSPAPLTSCVYCPCQWGCQRWQRGLLVIFHIPVLSPRRNRIFLKVFEVHVYNEVNLNFSLLGSGLEILAQISLVF